MSIIANPILSSIAHDVDNVDTKEQGLNQICY